MEEPSSIYKLKTDKVLESQAVPLYDMDAAAGLTPLFRDRNMATPVGHIVIPNIPKVDMAIYVVGDSMYPILKAGDIVLCKEVNDIMNNIFFGEIYIVSVDMDGDEYTTIKYIQKSEQPGFVKLVSYNTHHAPMDVPIARINKMAVVKASVRYHTMA